MSKMSQRSRSTPMVALLLALLALVARTALGQTVDTRAMSDKQDTAVSLGAGGGQSRTIYSQKQLSPHRMMHFGKRPLVAAPPSFYVPVAPQAASGGQLALVDLPLYRDNEQQGFASAVLDDSVERMFENLFPSVRQAHGGLVSNLYKLSAPQQRLKELARANEEANDYSFSSLAAAQQRQAMPTMKLMKMLDASGAADDAQYGELASEVSREPTQEDKRSGSSGGGDAEDASQDAAINIATRSVPVARGTPPAGLTRAHLSSILYGHLLADSPASGGSSLSKFNKKAEPQRMVYMHFG